MLTSRPMLLMSSLLWLAVTLFGGYFLFHLKGKEGQKGYINFGIDLVGGTYLTLDVKVEEAIKNELISSAQNLIDNLKKHNKTVPTSVPSVDESQSTAKLLFDNATQAAEALNFIDTANPYVKISQKDNSLLFSIPSDKLKKLQEETIEGNISVLRTRLDVFGAGEITIVPQGSRNIVIELPNVSDPEKAKARIGHAALLEMKPIFDYAHTKDQLLEKIGGKEPEGTMIVEGKKGSREEGYYLVPNYAKLTGKLLRDVYYSLIQTDLFSSKPRSPHTVHFEFNSEGAAKFYQLTKDNVGRQVAIVIDNVVVSAPNVDCAIDGGTAYISGDFTQESAKELVALLKSGAFSAPVEFVEERHIGPSLGQEAISQGLMSCGIGLTLLFLFSIIVYKVAGLFAFVVLLFNLLFILFGLALIPDATLTLPGIAGMILTVGMAIDSSILIYERIKEELDSGSSLRKAIDSGFSGATSVILDANITTFIVGAVLYYFGSPAIQGFALSIMIGIVSTLITGLILLKWFFNFSLDVVGIKKISI